MEKPVKYVFSSLGPFLLVLTKGATAEETLATVLCWLAIATASLGVALIITGWLRLAALVQYLPLPVIGGYLAFIGFCESIDLACVVSCHWSVSRIYWEL